MSIFVFLKLIGSLALLMYGMKTMSEALQKLTGGHLRHILGAMTTNRFTGLLTGTFVTASVQSSTATTVMTVSFVNAGLLTLGQAISVIMGANIGTTVTAWIMSIFGFQIDMNNLIFPLFALAVPLIFSNKSLTSVLSLEKVIHNLPTKKLRYQQKRYVRMPCIWIWSIMQLSSVLLPLARNGDFFPFYHSC